MPDGKIQTWAMLAGSVGLLGMTAMSAMGRERTEKADPKSWNDLRLAREFAAAARANEELWSCALETYNKLVETLAGVEQNARRLAALQTELDRRGGEEREKLLKQAEAVDEGATPPIPSPPPPTPAPQQPTEASSTASFERTLLTFFEARPGQSYQWNDVCRRLGLGGTSGEARRCYVNALHVLLKTGKITYSQQGGWYRLAPPKKKG